MCLLLKHAYQVKKSTNYSTFVSPKLRKLSSFPKRHQLHVLRRLLCNPGVEGGGSRMKVTRTLIVSRPTGKERVTETRKNVRGGGYSSSRLEVKIADFCLT